MIVRVTQEPKESR